MNTIETVNESKKRLELDITVQNVVASANLNQKFNLRDIHN